MKHNHDHGRSHKEGQRASDGLVPVNFEFTHPTATTVAVAGTFNNWHPTTKSMHSLGNGHWLKEAYLAPGTYEYCLVVDGRWMPDPLAKDQVPNPFGGQNSVLKVEHSPEAVKMAYAVNLEAKHSTNQKPKYEQTHLSKQ